MSVECYGICYNVFLYAIPESGVNRLHFPPQRMEAAVSSDMLVSIYQGTQYVPEHLNPELSDSD